MNDGGVMKRSSLTGVFLVAGLFLAVGAWGCGSSGDVSDDSDLDDIRTDDVAPIDATDDVIQDAVGQDSASDAEIVEDVPVVPDPALRLRSQGWLIGDLHMHSNYSDGDDSVAIVVGLAEYLEDPAFLAFHPEYEGFGLDFIALTDHRKADQNSDPGFVSDRLILIPGEEFGSPGHVNLFGVTSTVQYNPDGGAVTTQNYQDGFDEAAAQGALRSINHPYTTGILFPWDIRTFEAMEIWNVRWAVSQPGANQADIDAWAANKGEPVSLIYRKGAQYQGIGGNAQSLKFYEALLSRGYHVAVVGGSDRHMVFAEGFPATWVRVSDNTVDGVKAGIAARHTFVTRTPVSATVEMSVTTSAGSYEMGDRVEIAPAGEEVTIKVRVTRARGGRLFLIGGHHVESDEALAEAELGVNDLDLSIDSDDFEAELTVTAQQGDWFYPVVWEVLIPEGLDPELAAEVPGIAANVAKVRDGDYSLLVGAMVPYVDDMSFLTPDKCDPVDWEADMGQCMQPDDNGMATIFTPDWIDRVLNVVVQDGVSSTEWTMGAAGSAMLFVSSPI